MLQCKMQKLRFEKGVQIIMKKNRFVGVSAYTFTLFFLFYNIQKEILSFKENRLERISIDEKLY